VSRGAAGVPALRLRFRPPYDADAVGDFLAARVVPGLESHRPSNRSGGWCHERSMPTAAGDVVIEVEPRPDHVLLRAARADLPDTASVARRVRRWLDLDADPQAVADVLGADPLLAHTVRQRPGLRVPTTVDPWETCVRAVIGQQITVRGAGTLLGRLLAAYGTPLGGPTPRDGSRAFPAAAVLAAAGPAALARIGMPASRGRTLHAVADAVASGRVRLGGDREEALDALLALPGIGRWTRDYVALRALGDPDAFPATDLGLLRAARRVGLPDDARGLAAHAHRWRPWRAYAAQLLWTAEPR
jgi:AraC family transcriptional regulator of adaptative response / DNA-3-methyladenine glycosylase II